MLVWCYRPKPPVEIILRITDAVEFCNFSHFLAPSQRRVNKYMDKFTTALHSKYKERKKFFLYLEG